MTHNETVQILALLRAAYPGFYGKMKTAEIEGIISLWAEMFERDDFNIVKYALKQLIADHTGYPPDIAALKAKIRDVTATATGKPTHEELWLMLKKVVSNGNYGAREEFEKLPPVLKRYVGSPSTIRDYAQIDEDTFNTVNHGQFLKQIAIIEQREEFEQSMPSEVKLLVQSITNRLGGDRQLTDAEEAERRNNIIYQLS